MNRGRVTFGIQFWVLFLCLSLSLSNPALALRNQQQEDPSQLVGLEEALKDPAKVLHRLAQLVAPPPSQKIDQRAGLEEPTGVEIDKTIRSLNSGTPSERRESASNVRRWLSLRPVPAVLIEKAEPIVKALVVNLNHSDADVRWVMQGTLMTFAQLKVEVDTLALLVPTLIENLSHADRYARRSARKILVAFARWGIGVDALAASVPKLIVNLSHPDGDVRWPAQEVLAALARSRIGMDAMAAAVDSSIENLSHTDGNVCWAAQETLTAFAEQKVAVGRLSSAVAPSVKNLSRTDGDLRWAAQRTLRAFTQAGVVVNALAAVVPALLANLSHPDRGIRSASRRTLIAFARSGIGVDAISVTAPTIITSLSRADMDIRSASPKTPAASAQQKAAAASPEEGPVTQVVRATIAEEWENFSNDPTSLGEEYLSGAPFFHSVPAQALVRGVRPGEWYIHFHVAAITTTFYPGCLVELKTNSDGQVTGLGDFLIEQGTDLYGLTSLGPRVFALLDDKIMPPKAQEVFRRAVWEGLVAPNASDLGTGILSQRQPIKADWEEPDVLAKCVTPEEESLFQLLPPSGRDREEDFGELGTVTFHRGGQVESIGQSAAGMEELVPVSQERVWLADQAKGPDFLPRATQVVAFEPHQDDLALGSATLLTELLVGENRITVFTLGHPWVEGAQKQYWPGMNPARLKEEEEAFRRLHENAQQIAHRRNINPGKIHPMDYQVLSFNRFDVEPSKEMFIRARKKEVATVLAQLEKLSPQWVILPAAEDTHEAHVRIRETALEAVSYYVEETGHPVGILVVPLFSAEAPAYDRTNSFLLLGSEAWAQKRHVLDAYVSQRDFISEGYFPEWFDSIKRRAARKAGQPMTSMESFTEAVLYPHPFNLSEKSWDGVSPVRMALSVGDTKIAVAVLMEHGGTVKLPNSFSPVTTWEQIDKSPKHVNDQGQRLDSVHRMVEAFADQIAGSLQVSRIPPEKLKQVGISWTNPADPDKKRVEQLLPEALDRRLKVMPPIRFQHDAQAALQGNYLFQGGALRKGQMNAMYVVLGTGVGAGILENGKSAVAVPEKEEVLLGEIGMYLIRLPDGTYEYRTQGVTTDQPFPMNLNSTEARLDQRLSGPQLSARFVHLVREAGFTDQQVFGVTIPLRLDNYPDSRQEVVDGAQLQALVLQKITEFARGAEPRLQQIAVDFLRGAGREFGTALRVFRETHQHRLFAHEEAPLVLGGSVGIYLGQDVLNKRGEDLFLSAVRETSGLKTVVRDPLGYQSEYSAALLGPKPQVGVGASLSEAVNVGKIPVIYPPGYGGKQFSSQSVILVTADGGKGTRFTASGGQQLKQSAPLNGVPAGVYTKRAAQQLGWQVVSVVGHNKEAVMQAYNQHLSDIVYVESKDPTAGFGYAVYHAAAVRGLKDSDALVVATVADNPFYDKALLQRVEQSFRSSHADLVLVTALHPDPSQVDRLIRSRNKRTVQGVLNDQDIQDGITLGGNLSDALWNMNEGDAYLYAMRAKDFFRLLGQVHERPERSRGPAFSFHFSDVIRRVAEANGRIETVHIDSARTFDMTTVEDQKRIETLLRKGSNASSAGMEEIQALIHNAESLLRDPMQGRITPEKAEVLGSLIPWVERTMHGQENAELLRPTVQQIESHYLFKAGNTVFVPFEDADAVFITDLHGDYVSLQQILSQIDYDPETNKKAARKKYLIFGGDYVDGGPRSLDVLLRVFTLYLRDPKHVVLMAGNIDLYRLTTVEEGKDRFFLQLKERLGLPGEDLYRQWQKLARESLVAEVVTKNRFAFVHAAPPTDKVEGYDLERGLRWLSFSNEAKHEMATNSLRRPDSENLSDGSDEENKVYSKRLQLYYENHPPSRNTGIESIRKFRKLTGIQFVLRGHDSEAPYDKALVVPIEGNEKITIITVHASGKGSPETEKVFPKTLARYAVVKLDKNYTAIDPTSTDLEEQIVYPVWPKTGLEEPMQKKVDEIISVLNSGPGNGKQKETAVRLLQKWSKASPLNPILVQNAGRLSQSLIGVLDTWDMVILSRHMRLLDAMSNMIKHPEFLPHFVQAREQFQKVLDQEKERRKGALFIWFLMKEKTGENPGPNDYIFTEKWMRGVRIFLARLDKQIGSQTIRSLNETREGRIQPNTEQGSGLEERPGLTRQEFAKDYPEQTNLLREGDTGVILFDPSMFHIYTDDSLGMPVRRQVEANPLESVSFDMQTDLRERTRTAAEFHTPGIVLRDAELDRVALPEGVSLRTVSLYRSQIEFLKPAAWIILAINRNLTVEQILAMNLRLELFTDKQGNIRAAIFMSA